MLNRFCAHREEHVGLLSERTFNLKGGPAMMPLRLKLSRNRHLPL